MNDEPTTSMRCSRCDEEVDCCSFCDETDCPNAICYRCTSVAVGQIVLHPQPHGG